MGCVFVFFLCGGGGSNDTRLQTTAVRGGSGKMRSDPEPAGPDSGCPFISEGVLQTRRDALHLRAGSGLVSERGPTVSPRVSQTGHGYDPSDPRPHPSTTAMLSLTTTPAPPALPDTLVKGLCLSCPSCLVRLPACAASTS